MWMKKADWGTLSNVSSSLLQFAHVAIYIARYFTRVNLPHDKNLDY